MILGHKVGSTTYDLRKELQLPRCAAGTACNIGESSVVVVDGREGTHIANSLSHGAGSVDRVMVVVQRQVTKTSISLHLSAPKLGMNLRGDARCCCSALRWMRQVRVYEEIMIIIVLLLHFYNISFITYTISRGYDWP
jgi:hypothetical protein